MCRLYHLFMTLSFNTSFCFRKLKPLCQNVKMYLVINEWIKNSVYLFFIFLIWCQTGNSFIRNFTGDTNLKSFAWDGMHQVFYVGGVDTLYQTSQGMELESKFVYNTKSTAVHNPCNGPDCQNQENVIELLLVDTDNQLVVSCGTANDGMCHHHALNNILHAVAVTGTYNNSNHIVSLSGSTYGLMAPGPAGSNVFYFGRTIDDNIPYEYQQSVSSKVWNSELNGFHLTENTTTQHSKLVSHITVHKTHARNYKIQYKYGFSYNGFTYFVTNQNKNINAPRLQIRLVRVCQRDEAFYSYSEIKLLCKGTRAKSKFSYVLDAHLTKISTDWITRKRLDPNVSNHTFLFILAKDEHKQATSLCSYSMDDIELEFKKSITDCQFNPSRMAGLEFLYEKGSVTKKCWYRPTNAPVTMCARPAQRNIVHNIYSKDPVQSQNVLIYQNEENDHFRSMTVFSFGTKTVSAIGTSSGELIFYHIGALRSQDILNITLQISKHPIVKVEYIEAKQLLVAMDETSLYSISLTEVCESITSCRECVRNSFLCEYCSDEMKCSSKSQCLGSEINICRPIIFDFYPKSGPWQGNTVITFTGEGLGHSTPQFGKNTTWNVTIGELGICRAVGEELYNQFQCSTNQVNLTNHDISSKISMFVYSPLPQTNVGKEYYRIQGVTNSSTEFSFLDVSVSSFQPNFGPKSGGTILNIRGKNLHTGSKVGVTVAGIDCQVSVRNRSTILCVTSGSKRSKREIKDGNVTVTIDGTQWTAEGTFVYKKDPQITSLKITTLKRGGLNVKVEGKNLDSVSSPRAVIQITDVTRDVPCQVMNSKHMKFISPAFPEVYDLKRTVKGVIAFKMDGVSQQLDYEACNEPVIYSFNSTNQEVRHEEDELFISISALGVNLLLGCQKSDYTVMVEDIPCDSINFILEKGKKDQDIICHVPQEAQDMGNLLNVTVHLGRNIVYKPGIMDTTPPREPVSIAAIIVPVLLGIIVILVVVVVIVCKRRNRKEETAVAYSANPVNNYHGSSIRNNERLPLISSVSISEQLSPQILQEMSSVLISRNKLMVDKEDIIGKGHFGTVYNGEYITSEINKLNGNPIKRKVAIKTLSKIEDTESVEKFLKEGLMMSDFHDENVLTLIGISWDDDGAPMVVLPYMMHGDLLQFIRKPSNNPTVKDLVGFGLQACKGMCYLASQRFVHRDLAARNCMLNETYVVKVADFGLARDIYEKEYYKPHEHAGRMPVKWMALESLQQQTFTIKTDVWSFGILLWELLTRGVTPYPDVDAFDIVNYILDGRRLRQPQYCPDPLYELMLSCWHPLPETRPDFVTLVREIEQIYGEIHGVHYPGLDVNYINVMDVHPYPSMVRTSESRSTGGSMVQDVFSPGPRTPVSGGSLDRGGISSVPPPRNRAMTVEQPDHSPVFFKSRTVDSSPAISPLTRSFDQGDDLSTDEEGYLLPNQSKKGKSPVPLGKLRTHPNMQKASETDTDGYLLPQKSVEEKESPRTPRQYSEATPPTRPRPLPRTPNQPIIPSPLTKTGTNGTNNKPPVPRKTSKTSTSPGELVKTI
ncbi:hepatocyte growth factor receptor [Ciona intestinalis]